MPYVSNLDRVETRRPRELCELSPLLGVLALRSVRVPSLNSRANSLQTDATSRIVNYSSELACSQNLGPVQTHSDRFRTAPKVGRREKCRPPVLNLCVLAHWVTITVPIDLV